MANNDATRELYEGLAIQVTPASIYRRFLAYAVDLGVIYTVISIGALVIVLLLVIPLVLLGMSGIPGFPIFFIAIVVILLLAVLCVYHGYFIRYEHRSGITPGKRICGLQVISLDGTALTLGQATLRDMLRYIDAWLIVPGLLSMCLSEQRRRLGDFAAGTIVIENPAVGDSERYLFIERDDYLRLLETLQPRPMPEELCQEYLGYAFQSMISHRIQTSQLQQTQWSQKLIQYLPDEKRTYLDNLGFLLFFAEHCLQLISKQVPQAKFKPVEKLKIAPPRARLYQPGGFRRRFAAMLIDGSIISIFQLPFNLLDLAITVLLPSYSIWFKLAVWPLYICISLSYFAVFYRTRGATPGKMLLGLKVVDSKSGEFLRANQTIWRETIGKLISFVFFGLGYLWACFRKDRRTWHDFIGRTQVLRSIQRVAPTT